MTRLLVASITLLLLGAAPAGAAPGARSAGACTGGGVTVVVDYHGLGGGIDQRCDAGGAGRSADSVFADVGLSLRYVQRQPGFVCQVQAKPGDAGCVNTPPANAYWGLYWSDGKSGSWTYSSTGVGGLEVPDGGSVAFAWQGSSTSDPPGVSPRRAAPSKPKVTKRPTPAKAASARPTPKPAPAPSASSTVTTPTPTAHPSPIATASTQTSTPAPTSSTPTPTPVAAPTPTATASAAGATARPASSQDQGGGLPWWLPVGLVVVLAGGALGAVVWRRRSA